LIGNIDSNREQIGNGGPGCGLSVIADWEKAGLIGNLESSKEKVRPVGLFVRDPALAGRSPSSGGSAGEDGNPRFTIWEDRFTGEKEEIGREPGDGCWFSAALETVWR